MDKSTPNKLIIWKIIALFLLVTLIVIIVLYSCGVGWKDKKDDKKNVPEKIFFKLSNPFINALF